jgi:hypothetical protein
MDAPNKNMINSAFVVNNAKGIKKINNEKVLNHKIILKSQIATINENDIDSNIVRSF